MPGLRQAMLLAAGLSTRLRPLTEEVPKPLLPFWNRRILDFTALYLQSQGITSVAANLHHGRRLLRRALEDRPGGLDWRPFEETVILGTGGGIANMSAFATDEDFAVVNCDFLCDVEMGPALDFHRRRGALATLILIEDAYRAEGYGPVGVDEEGRIVAFPHGADVAKPSRVGFFSGIHILNRAIFDRFPAKQAFCISRDVYQGLILGGAPVFGWMRKDRWHDVGVTDLYAKAQFDLAADPMEWMKAATVGFLHPAPGVTTAKDLSCDPSARIRGPVFISEGVRIGENALVGPQVVVGPRAVIGDGARLRGSIVFPGVAVPAGSDVRGLILTEGGETAIRQTTAPQRTKRQP